ncbi:MAG TPA: molybdopterin-dependent oxidoreductase [Acidimicrobiales bacterium]|nr:molybdopterin-dependent oxidoreductase [Acidimicrobiales bacterium]
MILGMLGLGVAGVIGGAAVQRRLSDVLAPIAAADRTGLTGLIPAAGGFRIYSVTGDLPQRSEAAYRLHVSGLVRDPLSLTFSDLEALPATMLTKDFQCVTGWRVPDVHWVGVRVADLLDRADVSDSAKAVTFRSFDGVYTESLTLEQARRQDVIVAYRMAGKTVTTAHGGPVRLYVAPMYGYKSLKWLESIEVVDRVVPGYWERRGYDIDAFVGRSNGRGDDPTS